MTEPTSESSVPAQTPVTVPQPVTPEPQAHWVRTPPIDIFETAEGLVLRADLPGVTIDGLDLQIQDNRLTLFGRSSAALPGAEHLLHQEFHPADFLRSFILSDDVDHNGITAKLQNGVLEVVLPRSPKTQPRKIQVKKVDG
jgi:HSP20 family molecular chaperone IbpA